MKLLSKTLLSGIFAIVTLCDGQELSLLNGQNINISNNTTFYAHGLEFIPSTNFQISATNSLSKSSSPTDAQSINRVFYFDNVLNGYEGNLTFHYEESELNGIDENNLVLRIENASNVWNTYSGTLDINSNTLSYNFSSPINLLSVTASDGSVLTIDNPSFYDVKIYPNPVISTVYINTLSNIETTIIDINGKRILKTKQKSIDLSKLSSGLYIMEIENLDNNQKMSQKMVKN